MNIALSASSVNWPVALFSIENLGDPPQTVPMLSSQDLLRLLSARGIKKNAIASVLGIDPAGVSRLYDGKRQLTMDEGKKLVDSFNLNGVAANPLSIPISRLLVLYVAEQLGAPMSPDNPRVEEIARDFRAFSMFVADPRVRESIEAVQGFFQGLRLGLDRSTEA